MILGIRRLPRQHRVSPRSALINLNIPRFSESIAAQSGRFSSRGHSGANLVVSLSMFRMQTNVLGLLEVPLHSAWMPLIMQ